MSVLNAIDVNAGEPDLLASRSDPHKVILVGAAVPLAIDHLVAFSHQALDGEMKVRKAGVDSRG